MNNAQLDNLVSGQTGLISKAVSLDIEFSDPAIFIRAAQLANTGLLNYNNPAVGNGSAAGLTHETALNAALGECAERYSLSVIHPDDLILGSYEELSIDHAIPAISRLRVFSPAQYENIRLEFLEKDTKIAWVQAENITQRQDALLPACMIYLPYRIHFENEGEKIISLAVSTGTACAATVLEAICKAIYELIERDAFMIVWRNRLAVPKITIDAKSGLYNVFRRLFERPGFNYRLYYTTLDLRLTSVFGLLEYEHDGEISTYAGGACHPDPEVAVLKTLLELIQGYNWGESSKDDKISYEQDFKNIRSFKDRMLLYSQHDLRPAYEFLTAGTECISLSDIPSTDKKDQSENLRSCISILEGQNLDVLYKDITPIDIHQCNLSVARITIPGIELMDGDYNLPFLGSDRWRQVPEKMGLRSSFGKLSDINYFPHPYP